VAEARPFEPEDETAAVIGRLWRETLGPTADAEHTFPDLGGTSRQAMTLVRQVRVMLARDVSLEAFLTDPTLPGLVAAARTAPRADDAPRVVPLAPGRPDLPPLFFLHDAWGDIDVYWPLAQLLTGTGPLHGLRTDLHAPDGTRRTIAELAADHATAITSTAPTGPIRLAGHSFGGLVALETARRLTDAGRQVDFLGLIDVLPPAGILRRGERLGHELADRASLLFPSMRNVPLRDMLLERLRPQAAHPDRQLFAQSTRLANDHTPGRYDGPVTYFRARTRIPVLHHAIPAWRRILPRLTVIDVPGAHHDIIGQAHVTEVARRWSRTLPHVRSAD
jgi:acetoacetyl-CoA synthetase